MNDTRRAGSRIIIEALKDVVDQSGLSKEEIGQKIPTKKGSKKHVTRQNIDDIINGKGNPSLEKIEQIYRACGEDFGRWLEDRATYAFHKRYHDRLDKLLRYKGRLRVSAQTLINSLWRELVAEQQGQGQDDAQSENEK